MVSVRYTITHFGDVEFIQRSNWVFNSGESIEGYLRSMIPKDTGEAAPAPPPAAAAPAAGAGDEDVQMGE